MPLAALTPLACNTRHDAGYRGYAFVANEEGQAIAAVDLQALAVAKHIPLDGSPTEVVAAATRPAVYALAPLAGSIYEIKTDRLSMARKITVASKAISMRLSRDERFIYVMTQEPRAVIRVVLEPFQIDWKLPLSEDPQDMAITSDGKIGALSFPSCVRLMDPVSRKLGNPLPSADGDMGAVRFLSDAKTLIAANRSQKQLSLYDAPSSKLIAHLPLAARPDNLCFNRPDNIFNTDGGQLFITGEGLDGVVTVFPYHVPEVFETVLAGHAPGAMAASDSFLFVASPPSGDVSILNIATRKVIAVVPVGSDPGFIAVTPDDRYALVLNRKSGDMSVLRVGTIAPSRYKEKAAGLLTVIPVGSRPVSAAIRGV